MFGSRGNQAADAAASLYAALVGQARAPVFYGPLRVPDSIDGRFDLLVLHAYLVLAALNPAGKPGKEVGTKLVNTIFAGFEDALRDLGVGDMGMSRRIRAMADAFSGRLAAYEESGADIPTLTITLVRILYRGDETCRAEAGAVAAYVVASREASRDLASGPGASTLLSGRAVFGPLPQL